MKNTSALLLLCASLLLASCSSMTIGKSTLEKQGILVGKINFPFATITIEPGIQLQTDFNGYFAAALKPGRYALKNIQNFEKSTMTTDTITTYFRNYPMNVVFEVKPGAITDVGYVYIVTTRKSVKYWAYRFDIKNNLSDYLRATYPDAFTENNNPPHLLASGKFVPPNKISAVRAFVFNKELEDPTFNSKISKNTLVTGPLGLIATYTIQNRKITNLHVMDNSSMGTAHCEPAGERTGYCLIADPYSKARFAHVTGDRMTIRELPYEVDHHTHFKITRRGEIYVVNLKMQIHWSNDGGETWHNDLSGETAPPDEGGLNAYDGAEVSEGKRGIYVCGSPSEKYILFKANGSDHFVKIPAPAKHITHVLETQSGLVMWSNGDAFRSDKLFFTSDNGATFKELPPPGTGLCTPDVADYRSSTIEFKCGVLTKKSIYKGNVTDGKWALQN